MIQACDDIKAHSRPGAISENWETAIWWCSWSSVVLCATAEFFCNHGMFVENNWYNVIETSLWNIALFILIPCSVYLLNKLNRIRPDKGLRVETYWTRRFLQLLIVVCVAFVADVTTDHVPMQYRLWQEGEAANK